MAKTRQIEDYLSDPNFVKAIEKSVSEKNQKMIDKILDMETWMPVNYSNFVRERFKTKSLSYSSLKRFRKSPMSFIDYLITPFQRTEAMLKGSVVDVILTDKMNFDKHFFIAPEPINRRSYEGKAKHMVYQQIAGKADVISEELFEECLQIASSVRNNPSAKSYLDRIVKSQEWINWTHPETGLKLTGIIDGRSDENKEDFFIMDLKTAADASTDKFSRDAMNLDYHMQMAIYTKSWMYRAFKFPSYVWVVVETKAPYNVNVLRPDKELLEWSNEELHNTLLAFKYCLDNDLWNRSYDWLRDEALNYATLYRPKYIKPMFG